MMLVNNQERKGQYYGEIEYIRLEFSDLCKYAIL
jgi:hypothetical protein